MERIRFRDHISEIIRNYRFSRNTEKSYLEWIYRFLIFHNKKSPDELNEKDLSDYLQYISQKRKLSPSSHNQALNALAFFFKKVLNKPLQKFDIKYSPAQKKTPVVLSRQDIQKTLLYLHGDFHLMASLLYGSGLKLSECVNLKVRDIKFEQNSIIISNENGLPLRRTLLPSSAVPQLKRQIKKVQLRYSDNKDYLRTINLRPNQNTNGKELSLENQYIFPAHKPTIHKDNNWLEQRHIHESYLQKAVKNAIKQSGVNPRASCITFRHSFAVHLVEEGYDIHKIQELLGHKNIRTTLTYAQMSDKSKMRVKSPLDIPQEPTPSRSSKCH
jgi:integron integrase